MSNQILTASNPLWKSGKNGNIEFLSSFKRLEKEDLQTYQIIDQKEGYVCQDHNYEYRVGKSQYGLWASRRKLGMEGFQNIESSPKTVEDKPPARLVMNVNEIELTQEEIAYLKQLVAFMKVVK